MIVELGHFALILALALSLVQATVPLIGTTRRDGRLMAIADYTSVGSFLFVALSFGCLMWAYAVSDFSVVNVWENSHSQKPMLYKLTGTWGNHEGSMLLWVLILALFAAAVGVFGHDLPRTLRSNVLVVQGWMMATFTAFVLFTSNPFLRRAPSIEGRDLNPILQDIGLAIHPPLLYLGYVGFSITFAFAVAALIEGRIDAIWARWVRPWALTAWVFLTAGISMGSYWAYYELGWGGWWFWDPVENASLLPWLTGTALLHSALVMEKREALKIWTVLLAILTFSLSLLGTFLVRSGVLTSVHSFATDPSRGLFILVLLCVFVGGSLALFAWRANTLQQGGLFAPISREGALVFNNLILCTSAATVLIGTLYPLAYEAVTGGDKISVGAPFFNLTFGPLMLPLFVALPFGALLSWKRGDLYGVSQRLMFAFIIGLLVLVLAGAFMQPGPWLAPVGIGLAAWLMIGAFAEVAQRIALSKFNFSVSFARAVGLPRTVWSTAFAHFGVGVTLLGVVMVTAYETENAAVMSKGDTLALSGYEVRFDALEASERNNFREQTATFTIFKDGEIIQTANPSKRFYPARQMPTTEAYIETFLFSQLYLTLSEANTVTEQVTLRLWYKPFVTLIWIGTLFMVFGGLISLTERRHRVAAARRSKRMEAKLANA
ncbi:heme lyase CcmF/NrfE family subunit [Pseudahrensia aquimaris]|uniref:Heme lyase CcmF/NrfE family subunit n=1 Tax=Pseudahrensia aquimaris TaxID=744461 RepID=A0ABW3FCC9_9HYPH